MSETRSPRSTTSASRNIWRGRCTPFAGGSYLDIVDLHGVSRSEFYDALWKTVEYINALPLLSRRPRPRSAAPVPCASCPLSVVSPVRRAQSVQAETVVQKR